MTGPSAWTGSKIEASHWLKMIGPLVFPFPGRAPLLHKNLPHKVLVASPESDFFLLTKPANPFHSDVIPKQHRHDETDKIGTTAIALNCILLPPHENLSSLDHSTPFLGVSSFGQCTRPFSSHLLRLAQSYDETSSAGFGRHSPSIQYSVTRNCILLLHALIAFYILPQPNPEMHVLHYLPKSLHPSASTTGCSEQTWSAVHHCFNSS